MKDQYCSYRQFAEMIGCTRQLVSRMVSEGTLPTISVGKRKRIDLGRFNQMRMGSSMCNQTSMGSEEDVR